MHSFAHVHEIQHPTTNSLNRWPQEPPRNRNQNRQTNDCGFYLTINIDSIASNMINIDLFASRAMDSVSISGPLFILKLYDQFELATNHSSKCIPYIFMVYSYKEVYSFTGNDPALERTACAHDMTTKESVLLKTYGNLLKANESYDAFIWSI